MAADNAAGADTLISVVIAGLISMAVLAAFTGVTGINAAKQIDEINDEMYSRYVHAKSEVS
ncbi:MAG: hypothetical protein FWB85_10925 [Chitinispirillia bacterium]|nr:hypothetical protein [Chitinispirillia bacterium]